MPAVNQETVPHLRFELTSKPDRTLSEQTGREEFMNVIHVFVRAHGDMKNEFIDIAEHTAYDSHIKRVDIEREVPKYIEDPVTKKVTESVEKMTFQEDRTFYVPRIETPWLDKMKESLKNGRVTPAFIEHCTESFRRFKNKQDMPVSGYALINWKGIDPATRDKLIGMGINTVELVAEMNEDAMQYLGMGARSTRDKARSFLLANNAPEKAVLEMTKLRGDNERMQDQLSAMQNKLQELLERKTDVLSLESLRARYKELTDKDADKRWGELKLVELIKEAEAETV